KQRLFPRQRQRFWRTILRSFRIFLCNRPRPKACSCRRGYSAILTLFGVEMNIAVSIKSEGRKASDLLVLPFWKDKKGAVPAAEAKKLYEAASMPLETGDFKGKENEVLILYVQGQPEMRFALLGLGDKEKLTTEILRR